LLNQIIPESRIDGSFLFGFFVRNPIWNWLLNWYGGYIHEPAKKPCPKTLELLKNIKGINGAMFSGLPPGSKLACHLDPVGVLGFQKAVFGLL